MVPEALGELERFLHAKTTLPPLVKIALAHVQFETIHPFLDGNGRVGRLLITFLLTERGVLHKPVLYLSHYFKQHRQAYYDRLQAVRDRGDWEAWLAFFLRGVIEVAGEAAETARRILLLREEHRAAITTRPRPRRRQRPQGSGVALRPADRLRQGRSSSSPARPTPPPTIWCRRLDELGMLSELTGYARNRRFRYAPYIELFGDDARESA